jgi:uncharacterized RDD family membrane protein YckC
MQRAEALPWAEMEIDDRYVTATPEGVHLEVVLAGLASRFGACLIDLLIQGVAAGVIIYAISHLFVSHPTLQGGLVYLTIFLLLIGYPIAFELLWSGRTPGKRATHLRVVRGGGQPVGFWPSLVRNLLRLIDILPSIYMLGMVLILVSSRNQRLGDVVAGTVVVRETHVATGFAPPNVFASGAAFSASAWAPAQQHYGPPGQAWLPPELAHWDVSAVPQPELALVRAFLDNRAGYTPDARGRLAADLANRIWPFVAGPAQPPPAETLLECVAWVKSVRG